MKRNRRKKEVRLLAKTDTERLDWLADSGWSTEKVSDSRFCCFLDHQGVTDALPGPWAFEAPTLRGAVDAAIQAMDERAQA